MTAAVEELAPVEIQFALWGYAITGDLGDVAALTAEKHPELVVGGGFDRTACDIAGESVSHGGEPYRRVKEWAALPWVGEHVLRGLVPWPGL